LTWGELEAEVETMAVAVLKEDSKPRFNTQPGMVNRIGLAVRRHQHCSCWLCKERGSYCDPWSWKDAVIYNSVWCVLGLAIYAFRSLYG